MTSLSYTVSPQIKELLVQSESLRHKIILSIITPKSDLINRWEAKINRVYSSLLLDGIHTSTAEVEKRITHPSKNLGIINKYASCLDYISQEWLVNPSSISVATISILWYLLYPERKRAFNLIQNDLSQLLGYLQSNPEHPFITAAIAHIQFSSISHQHLEETNGLLSRLFSYLFLYKYGHDTRGSLVMESYWLANPNSYHEKMQTTITYQGLNPWIEYYLGSMVYSLDQTLKNLEHQTISPTHDSFVDLSERQKSILLKLENPKSSITNQKVQKMFGISQITASRDLTKLTALGLLLSHGKGRSVYYTKL